MHPYRAGEPLDELSHFPEWLRGAVYIVRHRALGVLLLLVMPVALTFVLSGCPDGAIQIQAQTANAVAHAANATIPMLVDRYRQEGLEAIQAVKEAGGTVDEARAAVAVVKAKWEPVWRAWESLRVAQDAWATALETGGDTAGALAGLHVAYCGLQKVWPEEILVIPLSLLKCAE